MQDNNENPTPENVEKLEEIVAEIKEAGNISTGGEEQEAQKYKEQAMRFAAENENLRKRFTRDIEEANKYSITKFARELIEVLENLHRAESSIKNLEELESNNALKQVFAGIELTKKSLVDAFEKHGIQRLDPVMGAMFDHDFHQAITQIPSAQHKEGEIVQVIQAGYTIYGRLLRPALVAVARPE